MFEEFAEYVLVARTDQVGGKRAKQLPLALRKEPFGFGGERVHPLGAPRTVPSATSTGHQAVAGQHPEMLTHRLDVQGDCRRQLGDRGSTATLQHLENAALALAQSGCLHPGLLP